MAWQGIEGHDHVASRFAAAAAAERIAGSHLFVGPPGVGKGSFARALAAALACERPGSGLTACLHCRSCLQVAAGSHPDIDIVAKPEDRSSIPLDLLIGDPQHRLREGLCWRLRLRPAVAPRKIAILLDADHLLEEAANCLLKTLEEPPPDAMIMLVGTSPERVLPTIRSRCQITRFGRLADDVVRSILARECIAAGISVDDATLDAAARGSDGSLHQGRRLLDPAVGSFRQTLLELLARRPLPGVALTRETLSFVDAAGKDAQPRRERLRMVLESAVDFYRSAIRLSITGSLPPDPLLSHHLSTWRGTSEESLEKVAHSLGALEGIDRNANLGIVIDAWTARLEAPGLDPSL
jgi:DNA polymerase-3 subunit delta'